MTSVVRVLVFDPGFDERTAFAAELWRSGYEPVIAEDAVAACRAVAQKSVVACVVGVDEDLAVLRALRDTSAHVYIIALGRGSASLDRDEIERAGANSYLQGAAPDLILGRLEALFGCRERVPAAAVAPFVDSLAASATWRDADAIVQLGTSQTLALPVALVNLDPQISPPARSNIELASPHYRLKWRIVVRSDERSARSITNHMLGTEDETAIADVMNELANVFMGALKHALGDEADRFTSGLPRCDEGTFVGPTICQRIIALATPDAVVVVEQLLYQISNRLLAFQELREGMVVAHDIYSTRGVLLVEAGMRLSEHLLERLAKPLADTTNIEVMP